MSALNDVNESRIVIPKWVRIGNTGILATPIAEDDTSHFAKLAQIISAFLSGYMVSKLDRFLERALYSGEQLDTSAWERTGLFVVSFLVMLIVVFINRWYLHRFAPKTSSNHAPTKEAANDSQIAYQLLHRSANSLKTRAARASGCG